MTLAPSSTAPPNVKTTTPSHSATLGNSPVKAEASPGEPTVEPGFASSHHAGSRLAGLLFNIIIPLAVLSVGAGVVVALGSIEPDSRLADDDSREGRLRRLPAASVMNVLSLDEIDKPLELRVDGVVVPYREVAIAAEVSGRVITKSPQCEAGRYVKQGQLLVEIDPTDYQQDIDRLTRMREQDYEALKEVDQEIINGKRLVELATDDVTLQEREVKRFESMPSGYASQGELDRARKSLLTAVQNKVSFENQLSLLAARRSKLEAAERLATTQLRTAEINLERTKIYSPVDGVIVQENAELNSFIQRGSPIATLNDVSKAEVAVNLRMDQLHWVLDQNRASENNSLRQPEASLSLNSPGASDSVSPGYSLPPTPAVIEYEISGRTDTKFRWDGMLVRYDGIGLDPKSRTVPVVIVVDQPHHFEGGKVDRDRATTPSPLVRGMFVTVRLLIRPKTPLVAIPSVAIQPGNRVWQFVPDESVLVSGTPDGAQPETIMVASPNESSTKVDAATAASLVSDDDDFDAALWQAGRVMIRRDVVPVDSLWLSVGDDDDDDDATTKENRRNGSKNSDRRYWICEIAGGEMKGGDWIVGSPLGEFDDELPVRVPVADLK